MVKLGIISNLIIKVSKVNRSGNIVLSSREKSTWNVNKIRVLARQTRMNRMSLSMLETFIVCHAYAEQELSYLPR